MSVMPASAWVGSAGGSVAAGGGAGWTTAAAGGGWGSAVGLGLMAMGGLKSAQAGANQASAYEAMIPLIMANAKKEQEIANANAAILDANARMALTVGEINEVAARRDALAIRERAEKAAVSLSKEGGKLMGEQTARYLKSGVDLDGTPMAVLESTSTQIEEDVADILREGLYDAERYITQGQIDRMSAGVMSAELSGKAAISKMSGEMALTSGAYQAASANMNSYSTKLNTMANLLNLGSLAATRLIK